MNKVQFSVNNLELEGSIHIPAANSRLPAVVVCHQHPLYGGNQDYPLVSRLAEKLATRSMVVFRFNFQGVGGSQGYFNTGSERLADVKAAITYVTSLDGVDPARVGLAGYSAGAAWGLAAAWNENRIKALAALSPPLALFDFGILSRCPKPKLLVSGSRDDHIPVGSFLDFCQTVSKPVESAIINGADHSWLGYEKVLSEKVTDYFCRIL